MCLAVPCHRRGHSRQQERDFQREIKLEGFTPALQMRYTFMISCSLEKSSALNVALMN